jgi:hypothetical protein
MMEDKQSRNLSEEEKKLLSEKQRQQEEEAAELLRRSKEGTGIQLKFDLQSNELKEVDELRELLGQQFENPEEKYQAYYMGIQKILMQYLPSGKAFEDERRLIYDEKNIFLNRGRKKSDNNGVRGSDGRMTYQPIMNEMVDLIIKWVTESQNPYNLYIMLFELNEKHGYGHEVYDGTSINFANTLRRLKEFDQESQDR